MLDEGVTYHVGFGQDKLVAREEKVSIRNTFRVCDNTCLLVFQANLTKWGRKMGDLLTSTLESKHWIIRFTPHLSEAEWQLLADKGFWDYIYEERLVEGKRVLGYDLGRALKALRKLAGTGLVPGITIVEVRTKSAGEIAEQENERIRGVRPFTRRVSKGL